MTVPQRLQPEDLAEVFEQLGSACSKLGMILKQQQQQQASITVGRPKKSKISTNNSTDTVVVEVAQSDPVTEEHSDVFEPPADVKAIATELCKLKEPKKRKYTRDPSAPKRPLTAYILYCQERRPDLNKAHPGLSFKELAMMMSQEWLKIDQKPYYEKAAELKKTYYEERDSYMQGKASEQVEKAASPLVPTSVTPKPAKTPKKRSPPAKRTALEALPVPSEPEMVLTQELIPEPVEPVEPVKVPTPEGEKKEKKRRKKVPSEPVDVQALQTQPELPVPVPVPVADTQNTTTAEPEKKKKKKKKTVTDSDTVSQASSAAPVGLLSVQPLHIH